MIKTLACSVCLLSSIFLSVQLQADEIKIAAATSLIKILEEVSNTFSQHSDHTIKVSYASTGILSQQILRGAPFDLLMSANESYVRMLAKRNLTQGEAYTFGLGRLVLYLPDDSSLIAINNTLSLTDILKTQDYNRLAIANPEHAPYGQLARQVLENLGFWGKISQKLVFANNASHATQLGMMGVVDAAFIPLSLAHLPEIYSKGRTLSIDESLYDPLNQQITLLINANPAAMEFMHFMKSDVANEVLVRHGLGSEHLSKKFSI